MELESVTLKLPRDLLSGAQRVATARDVTIGHMVRQLLKREVERQLAGDRNDEADGRLIVALQALLNRDMTDADSWDDLAARLRPHGYELRPAKGGLTLYKSSCGTRVCKGWELGFPDAGLVQRFGGHEAGHPHDKARYGIMPAGQIDPTRHAMLNGHFAAARSWPDLINRLACEGMELRALGSALGVHVAATGRHLCNSDTVGARSDVLTARFGKPLPTLRQAGEQTAPAA
jgi:hypothetical protein